MILISTVYVYYSWAMERCRYWLFFPSISVTFSTSEQKWAQFSLQFSYGRLRHYFCGHGGCYFWQSGSGEFQVLVAEVRGVLDPDHVLSVPEPPHTAGGAVVGAEEAKPRLHDPVHFLHNSKVKLLTIFVAKSGLPGVSRSEVIVNVVK